MKNATDFVAEVTERNGTHYHTADSIKIAALIAYLDELTSIVGEYSRKWWRLLGDQQLPDTPIVRESLQAIIEALGGEP